MGTQQIDVGNGTEPLKEKWLKEIEIYHKLKSTFIIEGDIFDKRASIQGEDFALMPLNELLHNTLKEMGYQTVVFFNHVDGFYNKFDKDALKAFRKLVKKAEQQGGDSDETLTSGSRSSKFGDATGYVRTAMANDIAPVAVVMDLASRYITSPSALQQDEQYFYSELLLATTDYNNPKIDLTSLERLNNLLLLVVDKANDVPVWFYLNNPNVKTLYLSEPDYQFRKAFIDVYLDDFYGYEEFCAKEQKERDKLITSFVELTDGFKNVELLGLKEIMKQNRLSLDNVKSAITLFKYGIQENPWEDGRMLKKISKSEGEDISYIEDELKKRVKGQNVCVRQVVDIVTRAVYGLSGITHSSVKSKPKGIMFFAGPTGTGKTETAKALAKILFGSEDKCIRFDMSEYGQSQSDQKLLGAPPGYVGYEAGGQLTNAVKKNPFSILLFDEIEKADPTILDKFLQILEDGRMTDGKGETVYFSDTIIIFTSNLGITKTNRLTGEKLERIVYDGNTKIKTATGEPIETYEDFKKTIMEGIDEFFIHEAGRPEIKNRIGDNFIVFEFIDRETGKAIADKQVEKIIANLKGQKEITLTIPRPVMNELYDEVSKNLAQGGRGVGNTLEKILINPLARLLSETRITSNASIRVNHFAVKNSIWSLDSDIIK